MSQARVGLLTVDTGLEDVLLARLGQVEEMLLDEVESDYRFVTDASLHLIQAGGKRFRPALVVLAAQFGEPDRIEVTKAAVAVELTHLASLYHDDVMDEAMLRRGTPSANARWGNSIAILTGDYLFAKSSEVLADLGPEAVRIQAQTFARLCTGQIRETVGPADGDDPVKHHLQVLSEKTGSLIATSARYGAMMSNASQQVVDALARYGESIGVAFQIADDLVDITSESLASGKTPGTDLREGVPTLATLIVLAGNDPADTRLRELLAKPLTDDAEHAEALALLRAHAAIKEARAEAVRWADDARAALNTLPESPARDALASLCDFVVDRTA